MKSKPIILHKFPLPNPKRLDGLWSPEDLNGKTITRIIKLTGRKNKHRQYWKQKGINPKLKRRRIHVKK